ncbi:putative protein-disulfide isomerase [Desulfocicer vacuolatum DSM 3385]|uniref:DSBA-like thioredoxin domain-containing protein n=1 Tax=Desulfocicer vacuolatum DSM 3385 TaxID=1121400 RepID=A0A1W2EUH3_9BACT|nr:DsbA family protein [Desulfocicer vacuolatum]SMD13364.1 putative protein-disulfide isomerase [Desulfocicer vacuolatum DSM 3385]
MDRKIIYIGDPMCSWCYGFKPELNKALESIGPDYGFEMIMGGLKPYAQSPMDENLITFLKGHWKEVSTATGQPFKYALLERKDFYYDSEVPSRAVLAVRELLPEKEFEFFQHIQHAFYAENQDTNRPDTYLRILDEMGISAKDRFLEKFSSILLKDKTRAEFMRVREMGVSGFPALLLNDNGSLKRIGSGYAKADLIVAKIRQCGRL